MTSHRQSDVKEDEFTSRSGKKSTVKMMYSTQESYLNYEGAVGVIKNLQGGYSFVALMPDENTDIKDYIKALSGEKIRKILTDKQSVSVKTGMPYFSIETDTKLKDSLTDIGIKTAFVGENADFSGIADKELYIDNVVHKAYIYVDLEGIKAGAATGAEIVTMGIEPTPEKEVVLNRPFVYIIVDSNNIPVFIGAVTEL